MAKCFQTNSRRSGLEPLCPGPLSRHTELLLETGFGRHKQIWVVDRLEKNEQNNHQICDGVNYPRGLFELGGRILFLGVLSIPARAKTYLRARLYPFGTRPPVMRDHQR